MKRFLVAIYLIAWTSTVDAGQLYKCVGPDGVTAYQQTPCPSGAKQVYQRYVAPVPNSPRSSIIRSNSGTYAREVEIQSPSSGGSHQPQTYLSNFEREEAARLSQISSAKKRSRKVDRPRADPLHRIETTPTVIQDYQGNQYIKPPGSSFVTDPKTGKQCFVNGAFIHC